MHLYVAFTGHEHNGVVVNNWNDSSPLLALCQVIDDIAGHTLCAACTLTKEVKDEMNGKGNNKVVAMGNASGGQFVSLQPSVVGRVSFADVDIFYSKILHHYDSIVPTPRYAGLVAAHKKVQEGGV